MSACYKCELLAELYKQVPKTPRNYWVLTELVVLLHGSDVCDGTGVRCVTAACPVCGETFAVAVDDELKGEV